MDILGKIIAGLLVVWVAAMAIGLLIAMLPLILTVVGFFLAVVILGFVGKLMASWIG